MDVTSTQQTRSSHWEEPYNYQTLIFFWEINVSKAEYHLCHQGNERQGV